MKRYEILNDVTVVFSGKRYMFKKCEIVELSDELELILLKGNHIKEYTETVKEIKERLEELEVDYPKYARKKVLLDLLEEATANGV